MALSDLTSDSVKAATAEFDRLGREAFLKAHRFEQARTYFLELDGKHYDSKAIAGVAHGYIRPGFTHLKSSHFTGGEAAVKRKLEDLGFTVVKQGDADAPRASRAPDWTRDELILALDLYLRGRPTSVGDPVVVELSEVLRRLNETLGQTGDAALRSPNSVYRTIDKFTYLDPNQKRPGSGGEGETQRAVWAEFHADQAGLHEIAETIRRVVDLPPGEAPPDYDPDEISEAAEGRVFTRLHRYRERNRRLVDQRKQDARKATGTLACEACGFDFAKTYGARGDGYIEAHHTKPVSTLAENATTRLDDLALLCSNCHRMIHAAQPWLDLKQLRALLATGEGPLPVHDRSHSAT
ncbi:MAG TPA: HNH endonuclease [Caulobacteraceae bacterium]|jgi:5-methylcytosine-specific restriction protein A